MADSLGDLVRSVWQNMTLAGEVGSLLKVEDALQDAIASAQADWEEKLPLFRMTRHESDRPATESYVRLVPGEHEAFWGKAEGLVLTALEDYARFASGSQGLVRQALRGRRRAWVRLDRPVPTPVRRGAHEPAVRGRRASPRRSYIEKAYPRTKNDLYAAFVECGLRRLLPDGLLGAITSRTGFFLTSFKKWREEILLHEAEPTVFADLGYGVLDSAMVETAAYCLVKCA